VAPGICYGATDLELADDVAMCADDVRKALPAGIALFSSPLRRCRALATALHPAPLYDERLRELDFGRWELRRWDELPRDELDAWAADPLNYAPPGGEAALALSGRLEVFLDERGWPRGEDIALVTHGGVIKILLARMQGFADPAWPGATLGYGQWRWLESPA